MKIRTFVLKQISNALRTFDYELIKNPKFYSDGLSTIHDCQHLTDSDFAKAYEAGLELNSWDGKDIRYRVYLLVSFAKSSLRTSGDFVELGTRRGGTALSIMKYCAFEKLNRTFYLMDTFNGTVESQMTDHEKMIGNHYQYSSTYLECSSTFSKFSNVKVIRGTVPHDLNLITPKKIAFLHIDLNSAFAESLAIAELWSQMSEGAITVFDDYGFDRHSDQKKFLDAIVRNWDTKIISLPTGQGLLIK
jgi:hypothetical protein